MQNRSRAHIGKRRSNVFRIAREQVRCLGRIAARPLGRQLRNPRQTWLRTGFTSELLGRVSLPKAIVAGLALGLTRAQVGRTGYVLGVAPCHNGDVALSRYRNGFGSLTFPVSNRMNTGCKRSEEASQTEVMPLTGRLLLSILDSSTIRIPNPQPHYDVVGWQFLSAGGHRAYGWAKSPLARALTVQIESGYAQVVALIYGHGRVGA